MELKWLYLLCFHGKQSYRNQKEKENCSVTKRNSKIPLSMAWWVEVSRADLTGMGEWLVGVIWKLAGLQTGIFTQVELCYGLGNHFKPSSANSVWMIPDIIVSRSWFLIWIIWGHELDLSILSYPHNILHMVDQYRHMKGIYFSISKKQNV